MVIAYEICTDEEKKRAFPKGSRFFDISLEGFDLDENTQAEIRMTFVTNSDLEMQKILSVDQTVDGNWSEWDEDTCNLMYVRLKQIIDPVLKAGHFIPRPENAQDLLDVMDALDLELFVKADKALENEDFETYRMISMIRSAIGWTHNRK